MPIRQRFQIPANDDEFEHMCLELLRQYWWRPGLQIFGKRGERQFGIDILDLSGQTPIYAAQCKLKEPHKSLTPAEIQHEVDEAKQFTPTLGRYAILTSGKVSTQSQRKVREINQAHQAQSLFELEVLNWEHICLLLQRYPEAAEAFYGDLGTGRSKRMEADISAIKIDVHSLTSAKAEDEIDLRINDARDCLARGEFQLATLLLNLIQRKAATLTPRQHFRILSNHAAAALGQDKPAIAAKFFLEAVSFQPDDEQAVVNEVLAYLLVGDLKTCHEKAGLLRQRYPASARLAALWITSAPKETAVAELEGSDISSVLKANAEVCVAFARRAMVEFDFGKALTYANQALAAAQSWPQPELVLAEIYTAQAMHLQRGFHPSRDEQIKLLCSAEDAATKALELARAANDRHSQIAALLRRVDIRLLLKQRDLAVSDAEAAQKLAPDDPHVLLAFAQTRIACHEFDEAISYLDRAFSPDRLPDIAYFYGRALLERGRDNDASTAAKILREIPLADFQPHFRGSVVSLIMQALVKMMDWPGAHGYLDQVSGLLDPIVLNAMRAYLAHFEGLPVEAEKFCTDALSLLTPDVSTETKEFIGRLFVLTGRRTDALPLWQELFDLDLPDFDPGYLLDCAARLHRDDIILSTCDRLHARGNHDWQLLEFELPYLQKYDPAVAIDRLQAFIRENPGHKLAVLRLSQIGLLLNRPELIRSQIQDLPPVDEISPDQIMLALHVLRAGGDPACVVDYAYRFLRNNFGELKAHQAMIMSLMPGTSLPDIPPTQETVAPGSAVCYQETAAGPQKWLVLDDVESPNDDFEEISLASPLALELRGKHINDAFVLAKGKVQDRLATIVQIVPKYVRRYQDSMAEMQLRFGSASPVESVVVGDPGDDQSKSNLLTSITTFARQRADALDGARNLYRSTPTSLHLYGSLLGKNAYVALADLALDSDMHVNCSIGTVQARTLALQALQTGKAVVIDLSAIATLRLLGLAKVLGFSRFRVVVGQHTRISLREMLSEASMYTERGGSVGYEGGRAVMYMETAEDKERGRQEDKEFVQFVEEKTEIRSSPKLAGVEPEQRQVLEKLFGVYGAESIILATEPDHILWTDDLLQAQVAGQEFGVNRVWTQLMLEYLAEAGLITYDELNDATARLIGMKFVATSFGVPALLSGFRIANWSAAAWPAKHFIDVIADPTTDLQQMFGILVGFVERLYREPISSLTRGAVARSLLEAFAGRPVGLNLLTSLRARSVQVFGINVVGAGQFDECYDIWLRHRNQPMIMVG